MLDSKFIVANAEAVRANIAARGVKVDFDKFLEAEATRRRLDAQVQELNRRANEIAQKLSGKLEQSERTELVESARSLREETTASKVELARIEAEIEALQGAIPNMADARAPIGADDSANLVLGYGKTSKPTFDFRPQDHLALAEALGIVDVAAGSRVAGHGFYFLKNEAVLLDLALQHYALNVLAEDGFTLMTTPDLARSAVLAGTGYSPRGSETQIYMIDGTDLGLIATSEITLAGAYAETVFEGSELPLLLCGLSHCFRTESGAHGRATRGLYRVHQFSKVEMFVFTTPAQSEAMHLRLLEIERRIFDGLGLAYRYVENATGDLGASAFRKFDVEAWMPGRSEQGEWGEVTSTSNCTDYQARRLNIRYRGEDRKIAGYVHTLNGTAVATARAMVAIFENFQRPDGSISIPEVLRPWVGRSTIGPR